MTSYSSQRSFRRVGAALLAAMWILGAVATAQAADQSSPVGVWKTIDDNTGKARSLIKIWEKEGVIFGAIIKLFPGPEEDPNPVCDKCQGALRNKPVVGMTVMRGLRPDGSEWSGGTIVDPESGNTYKCLIELENGGKALKVRGYIGFALIGRTQRWQRVN